MTTADDAYRAIRQAVRKDAPAALDGIKAARTYEHAAARLAAEYVTRARTDGAGWLEIGQALGLDAEDGTDIAVEAYGQACGTDTFGHRLPYWFPCGTCGGQVTDRGPFGGHPAEQEEGHADSCARFAEAVRAYRAQWDEGDSGE